MIIPQNKWIINLPPLQRAVSPAAAYRLDKEIVVVVMPTVREERRKKSIVENIIGDATTLTVNPIKNPKVMTVAIEGGEGGVKSTSTGLTPDTREINIQDDFIQCTTLISI
mmetsp:Transcript_32706/g.69075  ORF Transcript_32706/g.69075 Transcript_32706/m.69075 type:complete len:111 (+) Transcript_32706:380-712(+)